MLFPTCSTMTPWGCEESIDIPSLDEGQEAPWPLEIPVAPEEARFRRVSLSRREQLPHAYMAFFPLHAVDPGGEHLVAPRP
jgi:hypothetical protein